MYIRLCHLNAWRARGPKAGGLGNAQGAHGPVSWEKEGEAIFNGNCTDRVLLLPFWCFLE